jgi:hypothetical protein
VKVVSHRQYSLSFFICPLLAVCACTDASERRTVRGALAASAEALESNDTARFFSLLDERSRFAMAGTVAALSSARTLIESDYPEPEKQRALADLAPAGKATTAVELFELHCDASCLHRFSELVCAPQSEVPVGDEIAVTTVRGGVLHMHAGTDGGYGIVWKTAALHDERAHANRSLGQIRDNAAVYRKRRALETQ